MDGEWVGDFLHGISSLKADFESSNRYLFSMAKDIEKLRAEVEQLKTALNAKFDWGTQSIMERNIVSARWEKSNAKIDWLIRAVLELNPGLALPKGYETDKPL